MILTVLGSGSCELRRGRSSPAYHLQAGPHGIVMDLGQGALRGLLQAGHDPADVDVILLSHQHPDHLADIVPFLFALNYAPDMAAKTGLQLIAHPDVLEVLQKLQDAFGHWLTPNPEVLHKTVAQHGGIFNVGGVTIRAARAAHLPGSLAFRLEYGGRSLVYLGDSHATPELVELSLGADLLIANCAATDQAPKPGHLGPTASGSLAAQAGVKALLLSHLYSAVDAGAAVEAASAVFQGPVWAAEDFMRLDLGSGTPRVLAAAN